MSLLRAIRAFLRRLRSLRHSKPVIVLGTSRREFLRLTASSAAIALLPGPVVEGARTFTTQYLGRGHDLRIGNELLSTTMYILMADWREALHEKVAFLEKSDRIAGFVTTRDRLDDELEFLGMGIDHGVPPEKFLGVEVYRAKKETP